MPNAHKIELVTRHWSGKHGRVVNGINLLSLVWTPVAQVKAEQVRAVVPCDFRVYDVNADAHGQHLTKNDHLRAMLQTAQTRGFVPECVAFDSWYAGLDNLKFIRGLEWHFLTRLKANRQVNPDQSGLVAISSLAVPPEGQVVQLRGFGLVRVFQKVRPDGEVEQWATNNLNMEALCWEHLTRACWCIESYHRGIKQCCGVERAQVRSATGQKSHLLLALRAFLRLEAQRLRTHQSWYESKRAVVREAIRHARQHASVSLPLTA